MQWKRRWLELIPGALNFYFEERVAAAPPLPGDNVPFGFKRLHRKASSTSLSAATQSPVESIPLVRGHVMSLDWAFEEVQVSHAFSMNYREPIRMRSDQRLQRKAVPCHRTVYAYMDDPAMSERLVVALAMLNGLRTPM